MEDKGVVRFDKVKFPKGCEVSALKVQTQEKGGSPVEGGVEVPVLTEDNHIAVLDGYKSAVALAQLQLDTYAMNWRRMQLVEDPVKVVRKAIAQKLAGLSAEALQKVDADILAIIGKGVSEERSMELAEGLRRDRRDNPPKK